MKASEILLEVVERARTIATEHQGHDRGVEALRVMIEAASRLGDALQHERVLESLDEARQAEQALLEHRGGWTTGGSG